MLQVIFAKKRILLGTNEGAAGELSAVFTVGEKSFDVGKLPRVCGREIVVEGVVGIADYLFQLAWFPRIFTLLLLVTNIQSELSRILL